MGSRVKASLLCMSCFSELHLRARKADQPPAGEVLVAAVNRVGEHALHGVFAHGVEERLRGRPDEFGRLAVFERGDDFVLLRRRQTAERLAVCRLAVRVELGEAVPVEFLFVLVGARQRKIDVIEHVGIGRARLARRAGHQPLGECLDSAAVFIVEKRALRVRHRRHRGRGVHRHAGHASGRRIRRGNLLAGFGERIGNQRDGRRRSRCRADKECTTAFIMLLHEFLPVPALALSVRRKNRRARYDRARTQSGVAAMRTASD